MKRIVKKSLAAIMAFAVAFTGIPALAGGFSVDAANAVPAQVKKVRAKYSHDYVKLTWTKVTTKGLSGYTVYKGGKPLTSVAAKTLSYEDTKVKASTKYKYYVKAYTKVKQKRYYNSKTKKWQASKPAAKNWKGKKVKTVPVKKYGKASPTLDVKTLAAPKKTTSKTNTSTSTNTNSSTTSTWKYAAGIAATSDSISFNLKSITDKTEVRVYRGSKLVGTLKKEGASAKDTSLKAETKYSYVFKVYYKGKLVKTETKKVTTAKGPATTTTTTSKTDHDTNNQPGSDTNTSEQQAGNTSTNEQQTSESNTGDQQSGGSNTSNKENPRISAEYRYSHNKVILTWEAHNDATGFKVLRDGAVLGTFDANTKTYTDENPSPETTYKYTIQVLEGNETVIELSKDITTLSAPQSQNQSGSGNEQSSYDRFLKGHMQPSGKSVKLTWESNDEATGFNIYRDGVKLNSTTLAANVREYTDNSVDWDKNYEYRIEALDEEKNPLVAKGNIKTGKQPYVTLSWTTNSGADSYILYRNNSKVKTFTNADASDGKITYNHYVDALNSADVYKLEVKKGDNVIATLTFK